MSTGLGLLDGFDLSGLSAQELWLQYAAVGGDASPMMVEAFVLGVLEPDPYEHIVVAQALNEHFLDLGQDHPVAYTADNTRADRDARDGRRST